jgi:DNA-binding transcriptional MocR family regulator
VTVRYQVAGGSAAQISASVESGIRAGALAPGASLPPVRALAGELGVAPATVAAAYKTLRQRGMVETAGRLGTRVRYRPPLLGIRQARRVPAAAGTVDLTAGEPDPRLLPALGPRLRRLAGQAIRPVSYCDGGPWPGLVRAGADRLAADGVPVRGNTAVTVTAGALDAIERLLTAHLRPGDRVGVEDPGWANLLDLVAALGLVPVGVPVDDEGPTVDGVRRARTAGVTALVVTSRAQNPTGAAVTPARAAALRRSLAGADLLLIEDDHAAELADVPLAPLAGSTASWAFVRSVSKPYGPDLRVAVLAGDEASVARVEGRLRLGAGWVSTLLQRLVVQLWDDPAVATLVDRARGEYARRRIALLDALRRHGAQAHGRSGINLWLPVPDEALALARLRDAGWSVAPGSLFRLASSPGIRITVSCLDPSTVEDLAGALVGPGALAESRTPAGR